MAAASGSDLLLVFTGKACWYRGSVVRAGGAASIASGGLRSSSLESPLLPLLSFFRLLRSCRSCHSSSRASVKTVSDVVREETIACPFL